MKKFFTFVILVFTLALLCSCDLFSSSHEHTYETKWNWDENYHWHDATCEHKSEKSNYGKHTYFGETCLVCGYIVPGETPTDPKDPETPDKPVEPTTTTYSYTFETTQFGNNGTVDLGGIEWTLSGDGGYWGYDPNVTKGQQLGSGSKPYTSLKLISEVEFKGVSSVTIETSGASQINGSFTVSVGSTKSPSKSLTSSSTAYPVTFDGVDGKVSFDYTQTSSKAIFIKKITIVCTGYEGHVPDDNPDPVDITSKVTKTEGKVTIPFGVIIANDEYSISLSDNTKVIIKWTGFTENSTYSEFGVLGGQYVTFTVEGDDYVLYSLEANVYGTRDNMKLYQGKSASGTLRGATTSNITNGVSYTYVVEDAKDLYFVNTASGSTVWFYSLSFTYGIEGGSSLKPSEPSKPDTPTPPTPDDSDLEEYYESMVGHLNDSFKETLHALLKSTHTTQLSYTPGVWNALSEADEDPDNSNNVICIYTGQSIPKSDRVGSSSSSIQWNREHGWAKSHGFNDPAYYAYTDIHHLFASEESINSRRGNMDFNEVSNPTGSDKYGNSWDSTYFEPRDEVKGDIARAMLYMVVRYDDPNELDLELVNHSTGSSNKYGELGVLETLVKWHYEDPVSEKEKTRNDVVQSYQGNRNPFIDHPEWVALLYPEYAPTPSYSDGELEIHFLELGNSYAGDSVYIKAGDVDILIDAGSRYESSATITEYLNSHGVEDGKLEYVIATHAHQDHIAGFVGTGGTGIFDSFECETIIDYSQTNSDTVVKRRYEARRDQEVAEGAKHYTALDCVEGRNGAKKEFVINDKMSFEILDQKFYHQKSSDENNYSVCILLKYGDNNFLFTGDLEADGEQSLVALNDLPHCRLFKGGHHGSKTSSNDCLLSKITPEVVCVCCCAGSNEYTSNLDNMFPTQDFINRVARYTDRIYVTSLAIYQNTGSTLNTIGFKSMNGDIKVTINSDNEVVVVGSNNSTKLKDTDWFNETVTINGVTGKMRTWPSYGV